MIVIWTSRLGGFLFIRILNSGGDSRFNEIKKSGMKFFVTWLTQGLWVVITAAPLLVLISKPA
jgi:steroid 5-alpha reductase family enzyme